MIVVTGGAGFIGSAIVYYLNQISIKDIIVVDSLGLKDNWKNLTGLEFNDYLEKDEFLYNLLSGKIPGIQTIIHMGACSDTTEQDATFLIENNFEYTKQLAKWSVNNNIRFIYASSAATYGDGSDRFDDDQNNSIRFKPLNMYGYSKQLFDMWAIKQRIMNRIVGLKYFNVFGPNEYHKGEMRSLVLKAYIQLKETGKVKLFKSHRPDYTHGEQKRDFLYIKDAVKMTLYFLNNPQYTGLYNIGSGKARTWNDLVTAIFTALDLEPNIEYIDMPSDIRSHYQYYTCANIDKLRSIGYSEKIISLEDDIQDYVVNYLEKNKYLS